MLFSLEIRYVLIGFIILFSICIFLTLRDYNRHNKKYKELQSRINEVREIFGYEFPIIKNICDILGGIIK